MTEGTIFDPTVKAPQKLTRKKKLYFLLIAIIVSYIMSEYVLINTTRLEVYTVVHNKQIQREIKFIVNPSEDEFVDLRIYNKSPYSVELSIVHNDYEGVIVTSNINRTIEGKMNEYVWIKVYNNSTSIKSVIVKIGGKKV